MSRKREDLIDQLFTRWLVESYNPEKSKEMGRAYWNVVCTNEGNKGCVSAGDLKRGSSKSCGCLRRELSSERRKNSRKDISGQRFTRWFVNNYNPEKSKEMGEPYYDCTCDCDIERCVSASSLRSGLSKSCGCLKNELSAERCKKRSGKNNHRWKEKEIIICKQCGKEKKVCPSLKEKAQFCSTECEYQWMSENLKGENNPNYTGGKEIIICKQCGKEKEVWSCLKERTQFCGRECKGKWMSENLRGKNNHNYKGGITSLYMQIRTSTEYKEFVQKTLKKANYICKISKEKGGDLQVHHKKGFAKILEENSITSVEEALNCKKLWDEDNVIVLSEKWHMGVKTYNPNAFHRIYGTVNFTEKDFYEWFEEFKIVEKVFEMEF